MSTNKKESHAGKISALILFASAILGTVLNNSQYHIYYQRLEYIFFYCIFGEVTVKDSLLGWLNNILMSIYFLFIGLQIKKEFINGIFYKRNLVIVPMVAASFGMFIPAIIYIITNIFYFHIHGWAIPTTTDIAFTMGILDLLGKKISHSVKVLVSTIAIFDDILIILIVAILFTEKLSKIFITCSFIIIILLFIMNSVNIKKMIIYIFVGILLWISMLISGIHVTLSGIILSLFIPHKVKNSTLVNLEKKLKFTSMFFILPIFAFLNAGWYFSTISPGDFFNSVTIGIFLALFVGKQVGVFTSLYLFKKISSSFLVKNISVTEIYGASLICGIGFTMSLFIGNLIIELSAFQNMIKFGILLGSLVSAFVGYIVLNNSSHKTCERKKNSV